MALAAFKAQGKELTSPSAIDAVPYVRTSLQAFAANDPIAAKLERDENNGSPTIDNSGRGLIRVRNIAQELNTIYATPEEKEELERMEHHGFTEAEIYKLIATAYMHLGEQNDIFDLQEPSFKIAPPGYTAGKSHVGTNGQEYTAMLDDDGKVAYYQSKNGCFFNKGGLSATTPPMVNDDLIDADQKFNIKYTFDKDGNKVERTPEEADFKLAMTRIDNQYTKLPYQLDMVDRITAEVSGATTFKSAAPSGITADVKPTEPFSSAVAGADAPAVETKSIMFKTPRAPAPWEKQPVAAAPAPELAL